MAMKGTNKRLVLKFFRSWTKYAVVDGGAEMTPYIIAHAKLLAKIF
jgi:hypothetical protein